MPICMNGSAMWPSVLAPVLKLFQMEEELRDAYRDDSWLEQLEEIEGVEEIQIGDH